MKGDEILPFEAMADGLRKRRRTTVRQGLKAPKQVPTVIPPRQARIGAAALLQQEEEVDIVAALVDDVSSEEIDVEKVEDADPAPVTTHDQDPEASTNEEILAMQNENDDQILKERELAEELLAEEEALGIADDLSDEELQEDDIQVVHMSQTHAENTAQEQERVAQQARQENERSDNYVEIIDLEPVPPPPPKTVIDLPMVDWRMYMTDQEPSEPSICGLCLTDRATLFILACGHPASCKKCVERFLQYRNKCLQCTKAGIYSSKQELQLLLTF
jgi:Zinc finger, C3HC4 type (RING finger)